MIPTPSTDQVYFWHISRLKIESMSGAWAPLEPKPFTDLEPCEETKCGGTLSILAFGGSQIVLNGTQGPKKKNPATNF